MPKRLTQQLSPLPIIAMLVATTAIVCLQLPRHQNLSLAKETHLRNKDTEWNELNSSNRLAILRTLPKFGYRNLLADWTFLNFIQYFGQSDLRGKLGYSLSDDYFQNVIDSDPYFISSYVFFVNTVSVYAGQPERTIELLKQGLASMGPDIPKRSYFVWRHKGTDELLFIGDNKAAQESFQMSAIWAKQASDKDAPLIAKLSQQTGQFLAKNPNSKSARISAWSNVLVRATDDNVRQMALARITSLGGQVLQAENGQVTVKYKADEE